MPDPRPLGVRQQKILDSLVQHGYWWPGCGWLWDTVSGTQRTMDSLVRRGLVTKRGEEYRPTPHAKNR